MAQRVEENEEEAVKHFELLKISILARIDDYDEFYKRNFLDQRISFFEKQKFRLRKLIYECEHGSTKVVRREIIVESPSILVTNPQNSNGGKVSSMTENEVIMQVKLNKTDFKRIQSQKVKNGKF